MQVPDQLLHSDVEFDNDHMDELYMFIGLVALQDKTSMRVCPGSHRSKSFIDVLRVDLNKYEYIVCHPKLIHSGCGADEANYRLHFYHGKPRILTSSKQIEQRLWQTQNQKEKEPKH